MPDKQIKQSKQQYNKTDKSDPLAGDIIVDKITHQDDACSSVEQNGE